MTKPSSRCASNRFLAIKKLTVLADDTHPWSEVVDRQVLRQALEDIPPGQRAVLVLRYFDGLDVAGAAAALECSEGNVKSQTARGLTALKAALTRLGAMPAGGEQV